MGLIGWKNEEWNDLDHRWHSVDRRPHHLDYAGGLICQSGDAAR
jgi:hypothetical protein